MFKTSKITSMVRCHELSMMLDEIDEPLSQREVTIWITVLFRDVAAEEQSTMFSELFFSNSQKLRTLGLHLRSNLY